MNYFLLVVACLASQPSTAGSSACVQERIALPEISNETACYLAGRARLHEWVRDHADKRVTDARCSTDATGSAAAAKAMPVTTRAHPATRRSGRAP